MITNILLGSNDLKKAERFYDALLTEFGARQVMKNDRSILWKTPDSPVGIALCVPFDGQPASSGNGTMIGLKGKSPRNVTDIYNKALAMGASCEGPPGERRPGVYAAYFRDPDGNKFGIFHTAT
ncbi:VOC family protein [Bowmanella dokdonensis]|uniref:VOC family protein n=1 Tax=Bowmanella dokdonensis TaxID=751969 RepID=A0A939DNF8_9ALTE|nr:VOC family protein [Bowmanella dokdonensis]MBN7826009.1 VOC family protein [Bowmanella dokdonensis]